jgi:DtxR family manganese transport transcriptional regulator
MRQRGKSRPESRGAKHRAVRLAHSEERAEDYCEMVAELLTGGGRVRVTAVATELGVSHVTAIRVFKRLENQGLVEVIPYRGIGLTASGRRVARRAARRHKIVYDFLRSIGISERNASRDAEGIEHHVCEETLRALRRGTRGGGWS